MLTAAAFVLMQEWLLHCSKGPCNRSYWGRSVASQYWAAPAGDLFALSDTRIQHDANQHGSALQITNSVSVGYRGYHSGNMPDFNTCSLFLGNHEYCSSSQHTKADWGKLQFCI